MQGEYLSIETAQKLAKAEKIEKNWNKFKEWLEEEIKSDLDEYQKRVLLYVYKKIKELEGNNGIE